MLNKDELDVMITSVASAMGVATAEQVSLACLSNGFCVAHVAAEKLLASDRLGPITKKKLQAVVKLHDLFHEINELQDKNDSDEEVEKIPEPEGGKYRVN